MSCEIDKDCVFSDQQPECTRARLCCKEKLDAKDKRIAILEKDNSDCLKHMHQLLAEGLEVVDRLKEQVEDYRKRWAKAEAENIKNGKV